MRAKRNQLGPEFRSGTETVSVKDPIGSLCQSFEGLLPLDPLYLCMACLVPGLLLELL